MQWVNDQSTRFVHSELWVRIPEKSMVVVGRASDLNSLQSSDKVSQLTREQTPRPPRGIIMWSMNGSKHAECRQKSNKTLSLPVIVSPSSSRAISKQKNVLSFVEISPENNTRYPCMTFSNQCYKLFKAVISDWLLIVLKVKLNWFPVWIISLWKLHSVHAWHFT